MRNKKNLGMLIGLVVGMIGSGCIPQETYPNQTQTYYSHQNTMNYSSPSNSPPVSTPRVGPSQVSVSNSPSTLPSVSTPRVESSQVSVSNSPSTPVTSSDECIAPKCRDNRIYQSNGTPVRSYYRSNGSTVRGYYRSNGTYVRGYYRRR